MRTKLLLTVALAILLCIKPAASEHLDPRANWDDHPYHYTAGNNRKGDPEGWHALSEWFVTYKDNILKNCALKEKELEHKRVAWSFMISDHGEPNDFKLEESGGSILDNKIRAIIESSPPRQISVPPIRLPLHKRILVKFSEQPFCWVGLQQPFPHLPTNPY